MSHKNTDFTITNTTKNKIRKDCVLESISQITELWKMEMLSTGNNKNNKPPANTFHAFLFPQNQEQNCFDQDQFFAFVQHLQQSRIDDQRCSFEPNKYNSSTIKTPNTSPIGNYSFIIQLGVHFFIMRKTLNSFLNSWQNNVH